MNLIHRSIWNDQTGTFVAVSENTRSAGKKISSCTSAAGGRASFQLKALAVSLMLACSAGAQAQPTGGVVAAGSATIGGTPGSMVINQATANAVINWQSFGIKAGESVQFVQPGSNSVMLNRVVGADPSNIFGSLSANGRVFLVNPNGVLFAPGASVNVGGLVASTLAISDANFMARNYKFTDAGAGTVLNQGTLNAADGGYVALLGASVSNEGVMAAKLGTVALAAGNAVTLDMAGDKLLNVAVDQGAVNALVANGGLIQADGGLVLMTTQAAGSLLANAVNNTGVVQAQTLANVNGTIKLLGGMETGTMNVGGTLDASAPNGGNGGFIETSAATVNIANDVKVTTTSAQEKSGTWLIDPQDFIIGSAPGNNIAGSTLSTQLVTTSVTINTATGPGAALPGNGDIFVNDAVSWTATPTPTTLTLIAVGDVNVNAAVTAVNGNFVACCGRDVNVNAAITTTNGSVLLGAERNINMAAAITATDGNISMCAAQDIKINDKITLTRGSSIPAQSLGLPLGLVLSAGYGGTGTVTFAPAMPATVTGPNAPVTINYNPTSFATPTDFLPNFVLSSGATLSQHMLVFPDGGTKTFDGTTTTTLTGLKGAPAGVTLIGPGIANFNDAIVGANKIITFSGYTLGGADAAKYALPISCCAPVASKTTGNITAVVVPPVVVPPVVVPPVVEPPVVVVVVPPGTGTGTTPTGTTPEPGVADEPHLLEPSETQPDQPDRVVGPAVLLVVVPPVVPLNKLVLAPVEVAQVQPAPVVVPTPVPVIVPVETPPKVYVAPVRPPKQDRN